MQVDSSNKPSSNTGIFAALYSDDDFSGKKNKLVIRTCISEFIKLNSCGVLHVVINEKTFHQEYHLFNIACVTHDRLGELGACSSAT